MSIISQIKKGKNDTIDIKMIACQSLRPSPEILMHVKNFMIHILPTEDGVYFYYQPPSVSVINILPFALPAGFDVIRFR